MSFLFFILIIVLIILSPFIIKNTFFLFFILIISLPFIIKAIFKVGRTLRQLKITHRHLQQAPVFSPHLIDCYVKFQGQLTAANQHNSTLLHKPCVFYKTRIVAHWQTKLKKPLRGMTDNRKTLYIEQSEPSVLELLASDPDQTRVTIDFNAFDRASNLIDIVSSDESTSLSCPRLCADKADAKYQRYQSIEKWLESDAQVLVYGKLVKNTDGQLSLVPTGRTAYPNVLQVSTRNIDRGQNLIDDMSSKIRQAYQSFFQRILLLGAACAVLVYLLN